jgi:hypothetical protein
MKMKIRTDNTHATSICPWPVIRDLYSWTSGTEESERIIRKSPSAKSTLWKQDSGFSCSIDGTAIVPMSRKWVVWQRLQKWHFSSNAAVEIFTVQEQNSQRHNFSRRRKAVFRAQDINCRGNIASSEFAKTITNWWKYSWRDKRRRRRRR